MRKHRHQKRTIRICLWMSTALFLFFGAALFLPSGAEARRATYYVKPSSSGSGNGSSWGNAASDLKTIMANASSGSEIWVAQGTYKPTTDATARSSTFMLKDGVTIYGGFPNTGDPGMNDRDSGAYSTVLTGDISGNDNFDATSGGYQGTTGDDNVYHVVTVNATTNGATLDGLVIIGGNANGPTDDGRCGGIRNEIPGNKLALKNCTLTKNYASYYAGGMRISNGSDGTTTIVNCTVIENCSNNTSYGGGITQFDGSPIFITNCTFFKNYGGSGGGLSVANVTTSLTLINSTFTENNASTGGGLYITPANSKATITNCIFWGNTATTDAQISGNPTATYCIIQGGAGTFTGTGNLFTDPKLKSLADNGGPTQTCTLERRSPALNAGTSTGAPATDQRGITRPQGSGYDMGAVEMQTVYVNKNAGGTGDGSSWTNACTSLQGALTLANTDANVTQIWVAAGTYKPAANGGALSSTFALLNGVDLYGGFPNTGTPAWGDRDPAANATILSGNLSDTPDEFDAANGGYQNGTGDDNVYHVVTMENITTGVILEGITVTGGKANNGSLIVNRSGGGIWSPTNGNRNITISKCTIRDNDADAAGGGLYSDTNDGMTVTDCTFTNNRGANVAGGVYNSKLTNGTFTNCTFTKNYSNLGGGMSNSLGNIDIVNCTFAENRSGSSGAGIRSSGLAANPALLTLTNCTLQGNQAGSIGGGIYYDNSTLTLTNTILWGNTAVTSDSQIYGSPTATYCIIQSGDSTTFPGTGNRFTNPFLEDLANNGGSTQTCKPTKNSSALGAGDPASSLTVDQRGESRPQPGSTNVDIGAVEMDQGTLTVTLSPDAAVTAGAKWGLDGGNTWYDSGATLTVVTGSCTVSFKDISGYSAPASKDVTVTSNTETTATGTYTIVSPTSAPVPVATTTPVPTTTSIPVATPTSAPTATPVPGTPIPTISPKPISGDVDPDITITPFLNNDDETVQVLKEAIENPESDIRKKMENTLREEARKALEERLGQGIELDDVTINIHASDAYRLENAPLSEEGGTLLIPVNITYQEPEGDAVELFFVMIMAYDISTTPPTPQGYELVLLEENDADILSNTTGEIRLVRSAENETEAFLQVTDQSMYDANRKAGMISVEYVFLYGDATLEGTPSPTGTASGGGSGGCSLGFFPFALLLTLPLMLLKK